MKVLYDYQAFDMQRHGGVSNCFVKLVENMPSDIDWTIGVRETDNIHLQGSHLMKVESMKDPSNTFICRKHFYGQGIMYDWYSRAFPTRTSHGRNRLYSIEELKNGEFDVFHPTFFDNYFLPYLNGKPFVLTIHDMISELYYSKWNSQVVNKRRLARTAAHIIAVSEKTKSDIMDLLGVPEDKISVIYHGAPDAICVGDEKPLIHQRYLLYVGDRDGYKNFIPMMKELVPILRKYGDINVVCTGKAFSKEEIRFFDDNSIGDRMIHIRPDDKGMVNLYQHALCFIYPSLYEGFGIPILEAYQADCPVLLNDASCFPEIAGDAALYFTLNDENSNLNKIVEQFLQMTGSEIKSLLDKQKQRLTCFSWHESALKLSSLYASLI